MNLGPLPQSNTLQNWWQKIELPTSSTASSSLNQTAPSIAVYEQGDKNGFNGFAWPIEQLGQSGENIGTYDLVPRSFTPNTSGFPLSGDVSC